jgi:type VI secretion system protein ImpA
MQAGGFTKALESLLEASLVAPSIRERNRCKLLLGKLCLNAERPDLARPILEQLHAVVEQLQLEQWESPVWIADVIGSLYQCLTSGEPSDDDYSRAQILFQKLCTIDITKAMAYRKQ